MGWLPKAHSDFRPTRYRAKWQQQKNAPTAGEYILHHLTFLSNKTPHGIVDFSVINLDSVFFAVLLALVFGGSF